MLNMQFDSRRINALKKMILRLNHGDYLESIQTDFNLYFNDVKSVDILLLQLELLNGHYGVTTEDVKKFSSAFSYLYDNPVRYHSAHPVQIFKEENSAFQFVLNQINYDLELLEEEQNQKNNLEKLKHQIFRLGEFHNHYNRKEKLFFPIMERYGYFAATRTVWRADDRIRAFYQALKKQVTELQDVNFTHLRKRYNAFEKEFKEMIFQEENIILPILQSIFSVDDWLAIATESDAFGYAIIETPEEKWKLDLEDVVESKDTHKVGRASSTINNLVLGGGGYLTTEEAKLILNNLPLEITYI